MRQITYYMSLLYVIVLVGTLESLGSLLGSFVRLAGLPLVGLWVLGILGGKKVRVPGYYHLAFGCYIAWNFASFFWTVDADQTMDYLTKYFFMFGTSLVLWDLYRTRAEVNGAMQAFVIGLYIILVTTLQAYFSKSAFSSAYEDRYAGAGFHPNSASFLLAIGLPIAWHLATQKHQTLPPICRVINYAYPLLATIAIVVTASRGGFIAALPGYLYIGWSLLRMKTAGRIAMALGIASLVFLTTRVDMSVQIKRLSESTKSGSTDNYSGRTLLWTAAKDIFYHHPLMGVGAGGFRQESISYDVPKSPGDTPQRLGAHNTYLEILSEQGIMGLIFFLWAIVIVFQCVRNHSGDARLALFAAFISFPISMTYEMIEWRPFTWLFFTMMVISGHAIESTRAESKRLTAAPPTVSPEPTGLKPTYGL